MSGRGAVIWESVSTPPDADPGVHIRHRGARARKPRCRVRTADFACRLPACGCVTASGAPMPIRAPRTWMGATPRFRCPVRASRRVGMCTSRTPSPEGSLRSISPCGKAIEPAFRGWLPPEGRSRADGSGRKPKCWSQRKARAKGPPGRVGPQGLVRRMAWRRVTPAAPTDRWTANACSAASTRRWTPFQEGSLVRERPVEAGGRGCENTLGPTPHRALGEAGRSRHGTCRRCATAHPAAVPQDVDSPPDKRERRCESSAGPKCESPPLVVFTPRCGRVGSAGPCRTRLRPRTP